MGGDFNIPIAQLLDSPSGRASVRTSILDKLEDILEKANLRDAYRVHHPDTAAVTHAQRTGTGSWSRRRLDYIFVSEVMTSSIRSVKHEVNSLSDHKSVNLEFGRLGFKPKSGMWRHNDTHNNQDYANSCIQQVELAVNRQETPGGGLGADQRPN